MIKGKLIIAGQLVIEGKEMVGVFVECSAEDLRNNKSLIFEEVEIREAERERIEI